MSWGQGNSTRLPPSSFAVPGRLLIAISSFRFRNRLTHGLPSAKVLPYEPATAPSTPSFGATLAQRMEPLWRMPLDRAGLFVYIFFALILRGLGNGSTSTTPARCV